MYSCSTGSADGFANVFVNLFAIIARQSRRCPWLPGLLLLIFLSTAGAALGSNPQLTPGGAAVGVPVTAQSPPSPTSGSLQGDAWSVLSPAGAVVATTGTPNGWTFPSYPSGAGTYSLAAPSGAAAGTGYKLVWYYSTSYVGLFDVVAAGPPAAPTALAATAGNQYVSLTWTAPSGTGITYSVYRGTTSGGEGATPITSSLSGTSYTDSSVTNGTAYYYTVKAVNSAGTGPAGSEATATPQAVAPSAPTALTATPGNAQIVLSWTAPAGGGLTYNVYRGTAGGGEGSSPVNGSPLGSTGYTDGGLTRGTTYYYVVKAINAYGTGPAGNEASALPPLPPSAPSGLTAVIGNARVSLTWGAVGGAASYNVKRSTTSGGPYTTITTAGSVTGASYTDTAVTNGTTYYYVVSAVGTGGEGANSSQVSATPAVLTAAAVKWQAISGSYYPSAQSAASFTTVAPSVYDGSVGDTATGYGSSGTATVYVLWDLGSAVSLSGFRTQFTNGYYIAAYYSTDGVNWTSAATPASGSQQTFSPITARYVQFGIGGSSPSVTDARLYDGGGSLVNGPVLAPDFSLAAAATVQSIAPGQSGAADALTVSSLYGFAGTVTLSASCAQSGVTGTVTPASASPAAGGSATSSLTVAVAAGTLQGTYSVIVTGTSGTLSHTATVSVTVLGPPAAPTALTATGGVNQVTLSWTAPAGSGLTYNVYRGVAAGGEGATPLNGSALSGTAYADGTAVNGTTYYYTVKAINSLGTGPASNEAHATPAAALIAAAVKWQAVSGSYYPSAQSAAAFTAVFTAVAPSVYDGSVGDTATGYAGSGTATVYVLWDLGSAVSLSGFRTQFTSGYYDCAYYSTDGSTWTSLATPSSGSQQTFSAITARYVQFGMGGSSPSVTDTRLYDGGGTLVLPPSSTPPGAPTGLAATGGSGYVSLAWTAPAGSGLTYNVYRGTAAGGESATPLNGSAVTGTACTDGTAIAGTTYYYTVKASNGLTGPASNEASAAPQAVAPNAPTGLTASAIPGRVTLAWAAPPGTGITYNVYRGTSAGGESTTALASGLTATGYYDTGVTNGTTYYYVVKAVNAYGTGLPSNEASATPPVAPAGPAAVAVQPTSGSQATLYWAPVSGATSYNVYRSTASGAESAYQAGQTGSSYADTGLTSGTAYFYQVTAVGPGGESARSSEATGTPGSPLQTLAAPGALKAVAGGAQVTLSWSAVSGATGYDVFRGTGAGALTLYQANVSSPTLSDTGVSAGTTYSYQVATVNAYGQGQTLQYSPFSTVYATPGPAPLAAPLLAAQSGGSGSTSANLIWDPVAGATSYNLYRSTSAGGEGAVPVASVTGSQNQGYLTYQDTTTSGATAYFYRIAAVNNSSSGPNAGEGAMAAEASVTTGSALLPAPAYSTADVSGTTVTLSWSAVSGATTYNLYRQAGSGSFTLYQVGVLGTSYPDAGLTSGTSYGYYVAGVNATGQGQGQYYQSVSATAGSTPLPATLLAATAGSGSVTLGWNPVPGAGSYNVYRSTAPGGEGAVPVGTLSGASTSGLIGYTDPVSGGTALTNGTRYFYQVTAVAGSGANAGEGTKSNEASATPSVPLLPAVAGLTARAGNQQVVLNWGAVAGAAGYNLYRTAGSGGSQVLYQLGWSGTTFTDTGLTNATTYTYSVAAVQADGQGQVGYGGMGGGSVSAVPGSTGLAGPLISVTASGSSTSPSDSVQWTAVPNANSYNVYRATTPGGEGAVPLASVSGSGSASYADGTAASGTTYYYQVRAVGGNGEGGASNEASATPNVPPLPAVSGLTGTPGYGTVTLNWQTQASATSYDVYRNNVLIAVGITAVTYTDSGMAAANYTYAVAAVNSDGQGSYNSGGMGGGYIQAAPNDFNLSPSPLVVNVAQGSMGAGEFSVSRYGTLTTTPVTLNLSGTLPAGLTYSIFPQASTASAGNIYFCAGAGVAVGTYQFTLTGVIPGNPSPVSHAIQVTLNVTSQ